MPHSSRPETPISDNPVADNLLARAPSVKRETKGELECLVIRHPLFRADLLLQGAQLIHYAPATEANWLWLSEQAQYRRGVSVRGGIPVCWPWFGNADKNPPAVQSNITAVTDAPAHGFARERDWTITQAEEDDNAVMLVLTLENTRHPQWQTALGLEAEFRFTASSVSLTLTTSNPGDRDAGFSQAMHSYFPTVDIHRTQISGLDGAGYIDTLDNWQTKTQQGAVTFTAETDRIYTGGKPLTLQTPERTLELSSRGSQSTVVWNPWTEKAQRLSQFDDGAYQRMFCVETANAADDAVMLAAGGQHSLSLLLTRHDDD
ncbi:MAG: D-hexose-6-phosphate mutarotase [Oceanospirillaceae bacterium]|nr:D-hexose-6-phosphate mutarotase [Oceanospirillaceae bacterium]MBT11154.1 D-hexose-6-phosphate mutarotase [Oceanospirillaceae bacterium]|tara:strand:+ start:148815 stop:149768 length:954 start_codon:yes stop_codon:yes gene_type:complete